MTRTVTYPLADEAATLHFGEQLAHHLSAGCVVYLHGELGAGKTTLVRGLLQGLGYTGRVKSPTYTLVESYSLAPFPVYHFDLYRLADAEELEYLGMRDYFSPSSVVLIEWPERGGDLLPQADVELFLNYANAGRQLRGVAHSAQGASCLVSLSD